MKNKIGVTDPYVLKANELGKKKDSVHVVKKGYTSKNTKTNPSDNK